MRRPLPRPGISMPVAVLGTIALTLTGTPALAADARAESADADRPGARPLAALPTVSRDATASAPREIVAARTASAPAITPAKKRPSTHTVRAGETVSAIAAKHGLRTADVLAWNGLGWKTIIRPGDVVRLTPRGTAAPATAAAKPKPKPAAAAPGKTYTVRAGDTLWSIARSHDVALASLRAANSLPTTNLIHPGQRLRIPGAAAAPAGSKPAKPAKTSQASPARTPAATHYTVRQGDTMWAIAQTHGVSLSRLLSANDLNAASIIYPGQRLTIPGKKAGSTAGLDAEQIANAKTIIAVGRDRGVPDRGIAIALAAAMVESGIRNLDDGDRDSLGVFQQRPSQGWGSKKQVRDVRRAAAVFFGGPRDPNGTDTRGLLDIPGWKKLGFSEAAQAVQVSAYPDRYGEWEKQAKSWLAALG